MQVLLRELDAIQKVRLAPKLLLTLCHKLLHYSVSLCPLLHVVNLLPLIARSYEAAPVLPPFRTFSSLRLSICKSKEQLSSFFCRHAPAWVRREATIPRSLSWSSRSGTTPASSPQMGLRTDQGTSQRVRRDTTLCRQKRARLQWMRQPFASCLRPSPKPMTSCELVFLLSKQMECICSFSHDEVNAPLRSYCERIHVWGTHADAQTLAVLALHRHCGGYGHHPPRPV